MLAVFQVADLAYLLLIGTAGLLQNIGFHHPIIQTMGCSEASGKASTRNEHESCFAAK